MRWSLSALLLVMAIVACAFGIFTAFWDRSHPNHTILLGAFILLVTVSSVAAVFGSETFRVAFIGASIFGIAYLIFVLHCGFGLETIYDSEHLARNTKIGFAWLGVSFLASKLAQMTTWPNSTSQTTPSHDQLN